MKSIENCVLYGIIDMMYIVPEQAVATTERLINGGVDILQLRAKEASHKAVIQLAEAILPVIRQTAVPLILNDHPELLREVDADGCHVGQDDLSVAEARLAAARPCLVGRSTHTIEQAEAATSDGADYIGYGPIFSTKTKPSASPVGLALLAELHERVRIPIFCIGGIKSTNLRSLLAAGSKRVCIVSDLLLATDIERHTANIKKQLDSSV